MSAGLIDGGTDRRRDGSTAGLIDGGTDGTERDGVILATFDGTGRCTGDYFIFILYSIFILSRLRFAESRRTFRSDLQTGACRAAKQGLGPALRRRRQ